MGTATSQWCVQTPGWNNPVPYRQKMTNLLLKVLGMAFVALGFAGVFLPLLPTTPFLLLAAACFARSSPAFHDWLLSHRLLGPYIRDWERDWSEEIGVKLLPKPMRLKGDISVSF